MLSLCSLLNRDSVMEISKYSNSVDVEKKIDSKVWTHSLRPHLALVRRVHDDSPRWGFTANRR